MFLLDIAKQLVLGRRDTTKRVIEGLMLKI
jgi:hypothetical protein